MSKKKVYTELTSLHRESYGSSYAKVKPKPECCAEGIIVYTGNWPRPRQCSKPRGYGPEEAYCKTHDPATKKAKREAQEAKHQMTMNKWHDDFRRKQSYDYLKDALTVISNGHNDPRGYATEKLAALEIFVRTGKWPDSEE